MLRAHRLEPSYTEPLPDALAIVFCFRPCEDLVLGGEYTLLLDR